ncbi:hypothetical protein BT69DRAFT_1215198 [Atractiella rhizophila]|nr:hypothetical protein BT69DRAFT_1215198 [Atractiella rhizophila]
MQLATLQDESDRVAHPQRIKLKTSQIFDPFLGQFLHNKVIKVDVQSGLIVAIYDGKDDEEEPNCQIVDLSKDGQTVLPGFIDTHLLHPFAEAAWEVQVTQESIVERTLRAANHARATLLAGYTTVRDLGSEGAYDSDIHFRNSLQKGLIPGPRMFAVTRGIVATGVYGPKVGNKWDDVNGTLGELPHGAEVADGVDKCLKVVRRQVGAGADIIKIYGDYRFRSRMVTGNPAIAAASYPLFTERELSAMVQQAHSLLCPVAVHTDSDETIALVCSKGVDTVEHGMGAGEKALTALAKTGTIWTPTLAVLENYYRDATLAMKQAQSQVDFLEKDLQNGFRNALSRYPHDIKFSTGGDTGPFTHGRNSWEMQLMVELGADWKDVLKWSTVHGEEACRGVRNTQWKQTVGVGKEKGQNAMRFGRLKVGYSADIIATTGNLEKNFQSAVQASSISFVMKMGTIYKINGRATTV